MKNKLLLLAIILFIGLFLRIYDLDGESMWFDEGNSVHLARLSPLEIILEPGSHVHPPLYFITLHYWINLFGEVQFSMRFLSVIFGFLALLLMYRLGAFIFDRTTGILSTLILALSTFHIHHSQEVRMYTIVTFFILLSMYFFLKLLKEKKYINSLGYILSTAFLLYTHYSSFLIILLQTIYLISFLISSKEDHILNIKRWIMFQLILLLLYLPWLWVFVFQTIKIQTLGPDMHTASAHSIYLFLLEYAGVSLFLLIFFLILACFSIFKIKNKRLRIDRANAGKIYLLLLWFFVPLGAIFLISKFTFLNFRSRYTIASSLALYLLVAKGIRNINYKYIKSIIITVLIASSLLSCWKYYININKVGWEEIISVINKNGKAGDLLIFNCRGCKRSIFDNYFKRTDMETKYFSEELIYSPIRLTEKNVKGLILKAEDHRRVWIVLSHEADYKKLIMKEFVTSFDRLSYHNIYSATSYSGYDFRDATEIFLFEK